jgi:hypothetical protein
MDIAIIIVLIFFVIILVTRNAVSVERKMIEDMKRKKGQCPPHKWFYRKQPGTDDEYMVCELCGMLPGGMYVEVDHDSD